MDSISLHRSLRPSPPLFSTGARRFLAPRSRAEPPTPKRFAGVRVSSPPEIRLRGGLGGAGIAPARASSNGARFGSLRPEESGEAQAPSFAEFITSERVKVAAMLALALALCNADRVVMSVAIVPLSLSHGWTKSFAGIVQVWLGSFCDRRAISDFAKNFVRLYSFVFVDYYCLNVRTLIKLFFFEAMFVQSLKLTFVCIWNFGKGNGLSKKVFLLEMPLITVSLFHIEKL